MSCFFSLNGRVQAEPLAVFHGLVLAEGTRQLITSNTFTLDSFSDLMIFPDNVYQNIGTIPRVVAFGL